MAWDYVLRLEREIRDNSRGGRLGEVKPALNGGDQARAMMLAAGLGVHVAPAQDT
jgi:hypothetical protein